MNEKRQPNKWKAGDLVWVAEVDDFKARPTVVAIQVRVVRPHGIRQVVLDRRLNALDWSVRVESDLLSATPGEAFEKLSERLQREAKSLTEKAAQIERSITRTETLVQIALDEARDARARGAK